MEYYRQGKESDVKAKRARGYRAAREIGMDGA
jgi:hypothetical protein